jgi:hypothetical protein
LVLLKIEILHSKVLRFALCDIFGEVSGRPSLLFNDLYMDLIRIRSHKNKYNYVTNKQVIETATVVAPTTTLAIAALVVKKLLLNHNSKQPVNNQIASNNDIVTFK